MGLHIAKLTTAVKFLLVDSKKLEADVAIDRQSRENAQYSKRDTLEVVQNTYVCLAQCNSAEGLWPVPGNWRGNMWSRHSDLSSLEGWRQNNCQIFQRKDSLQIQRVKRQLKGLDPSVVGFPVGTKVFFNFCSSIFWYLFLLPWMQPFWDLSLSFAK